MSRRLISRSQDLKRLRDAGYDVDVRFGYLLLRHIPYVNSRGEIKFGTLVSELSLAGDVTTRPSTHVMHFAGEYPCKRDGSPITAIQHQSVTTNLGGDLVINHSFSSKPRSGAYDDYFDKMSTYATILASQAEAIDPRVTAKSFPVVEATEEESVFHYTDTASSRAEITAVTQRLELSRVAIIGLGGTGSYVLDLVAKTPVREIHLYDGDVFLQHNAFRSPGAAGIDDLRVKPKKATYFREQYSRMHRHIIAHEECIDASNAKDLAGLEFVFLCLDRGAAKKLIVEYLETFGTPFVDVGLGVYLVDGALAGVVRVSTSTAAQRSHIHTKFRIPFSDGDENNEYATNIQVADLNALNAALAVIKWKKLFGFYMDLEQEHHCVYTIDGNALTNEDQP